METILFTVASKKKKNKNKYLGVNLTKDVNDLQKEISEYYRRWKIPHAHGLVEST
jgi:hypothetical protein